MDRLRSLQYFIACAETGSLSAAARSMEVTVPAVAKLLGSLERDLGATLFERSAQGLQLTAAGESYLESCRPAVDALAEADDRMRTANTRARGTVVVGVQNVVARILLGPTLPRFHARYPDVQVDLREATQVSDPDAPGIDVYLSFAWPKAEDMIHRALGVTSFTVCASPAYWARMGMPATPRDLERHDCLLIRTQRGTVMDMWSFERDGVREDVAVKGWLVCNNTHRDVAISMAAAGHGVIRVLVGMDKERLSSGALVPALPEWHCADSPPIVLSYRPSARRVARVRAFIEFVQEIFAGAGSRRGGEASLSRAPVWSGTSASRASSLMDKRKR